MTQRKPISKKMRFEVFKRDSFTCQYCGKSSPDVVLEVDHLKPVASGGKNNLLNLITSCYDCNRGKGKTLLDDNTMVTKQKEQLDLINEKRNQLKLMLKWREELNNLLEEQLDEINSVLDAYNKSLSDIGRRNFKSYIKKYGFFEVLDCLEISFEQYYYDNKNNIEEVLKYVPKICEIRLRQKTDPLLHKKMSIRRLILNNYNYYNKQILSKYLDLIITSEENAKKFESIAYGTRKWNDLISSLNKEFNLGE